ncbi:MAG: hypothetical protein CVT92_08550 [Bacteroidetes bacterium HGW-Bacteroidetes-1]|jgi:PAS domain S-box-containing protein|nr:MAG: hypothetical protein CVT92_08550 [Bacteroidetes bacterium HGW-Bacteroidetes-1]
MSDNMENSMYSSNKYVGDSMNRIHEILQNLVKDLIIEVLVFQRIQIDSGSVKDQIVFADKAFQNFPFGPTHQKILEQCESVLRTNIPTSFTIDNPLFSEEFQFSVNEIQFIAVIFSLSPDEICMISVSQPGKDMKPGDLFKLLQHYTLLISGIICKGELFQILDKKNFYKAIFSGFSDAILIFDENMNVKAVNEKAARFIGKDEDVLEGSTIDQLSEMLTIEGLSPSALIMDGIKEAESKSDRIFEVSLTNSGGNKCECEVMFSLVSPKRYILNIKDVSSHHQKEQLLIEARQKAEENDKLKSAFLANMSHEIRTPLNSIIGFSDILLENESDKLEAHEFTSMINSAGKTLLKLIDDIIDLSKIEAGQIKISNSEMDINQVLDELMITFENEKKNRHKEHIELHLLKPFSKSPFQIYTDPYRFRQIMSNILTNALKFVDEGSITFGYTETKSDFVQFFVKDTGVGIEREKAHLIFQRFGQLDASSRRNRQGTGLGLSITKQLIELMGGEIWFDSEQGKGTTFYFTIPFGQHNTSYGVSLSEFERISMDWSEHVFLVVDDVQANYLLIKNILNKSGALILWAKDGFEAVRVCRNNKAISLVLMDIMMPQLTGYEATKQIKSFAPHLPIVAQTAFANTKGRAEAFKAGCDDYLTKPVNQVEMISVIKKLLK